MRILRILLCVGLLLMSACGSPNRPSYEARSGLIFVGTFIVFYDSEGPLSFQTMTPREVPKNAELIGEVTGDSCQHGLSIPIFLSASDRFSLSGAKGDGSYKKALLNIREKHPDIAGLYDVKVDVHQWSILTYNRDCTVVVAQGFKRPNSSTTSQISKSAHN